MSIKSKIQSLITSANAVTGESDTDLTGAVQTLCDGFGGGGDIPSDYQLCHDIAYGGAAEIVLPDSMTSIRSGLFYLYGNSLRTITIPATCTVVNSGAFASNDNLSEIVFPPVKRDENGNITNFILFTGQQHFYCVGGSSPADAPIRAMQIPENVLVNNTSSACFSSAGTSMYVFTFDHVPQAWTIIPTTCFMGCKAITSFTIHAGITEVRAMAFYTCSGLTNVAFEGTPKSIATNAFQSCPSLTSIKVPWANGAVSGAPWGATNATIEYNYTGGDA